MKRAALLLALALQAHAAQAQDWVIVSRTSRAEAGSPFEITVVAPPGQTLPAELDVRMKVDVAEITLTMQAAGPPRDARRSYTAPMPVSASGPVSLQLSDYPSNMLVMIV